MPNKKKDSRRNKNNRNRKKTIKHRIRIPGARGRSMGGGILNNISKSVIQLPNAISTLNTQVIFNYGQPNQLEVKNMNPPIILSSIMLGNLEPVILISDNGKYLVTMIENTPVARFIWLAFYNQGIKVQTILPYLQPQLPYGQIRDYTFSLYKLADTTPVYNTIEIPNSNRTEEVIKFMIYLEKNKGNIRKIGEMDKSFKIRGMNKTGIGIGLEGSKIAARNARKQEYKKLAMN